MPKEIILQRPAGKRLTAAEIAVIEAQGLPDDVARITVKDTQVQGLELRLTRRGRTWSLSKRYKGQQRRWAFPGHLSLAEARAEATKLRAELARGIDPKEVAAAEAAAEAAEAAALAAAEEARRGAPTLRWVIEEYERIEQQGETARNKSWPARKAHIMREYRAFLDRPAGEIESEDIIGILDDAKVRQKRVSGWRGAQYLRPVLAWAATRTKKTGVKINAVAAIGKDVLKKTRKKMNHELRTKVLEPAEIAALWKVWSADPADTYGRLMMFALTTGQRRSECAAIRWEDVDLERRVWRQSENKSDRPHDVPLSSLAVELMGRPGSGLVFPNRAGSSLEGDRGNWTRAVKRFSAAAGVTGWKTHDLRRTFATRLVKLGVGFTARELLLNHSEKVAKGGELGATYDQHDYVPEKAEAVELLAEWLRRLIERPEGAEVIELRAS